MVDRDRVRGRVIVVRDRDRVIVVRDSNYS